MDMVFVLFALVAIILVAYLVQQHIGGPPLVKSGILIVLVLLALFILLRALVPSLRT